MHELRPPGLGDPAQRAANARRALVAVALLLAVLTGWHVFNLPGSAIKRNSSPPDFSGMNYGLRQIWIVADGTWTLWREGYLDRMQMYYLDPQGRLTAERDKQIAFEGNDVSGVAHGSPKLMAGGYGLKLRGSPSFFEMIRKLRPPEVPGSISDVTTEIQQRAEDAASGKLPFTPQAGADDGKAAPPEDAPREYYDPARDWGAPAGAQLREEDGIIVQVSDRLLQVLPGHVYYPSRDSYAFLDTHLWIVSDQQHWLHRVEASEQDGKVVLTPVAAQKLDIAGRTKRDCIVGRDPISGELFIALADGELLHFDAMTLKPLDTTQLPGEWRQEYAALSLAALPYSPELGWPLSKVAYRRLMALLMVVFIASLLVLVTEWRKAWKFTSAATTADTSSSSS